MGVACDLGYPCAKFRLPRPFGFRVRADVRDIRQTDDGRRSPLNAPAPLRGGGIIIYIRVYNGCVYSVRENSGGITSYDSSSQTDTGRRSAPAARLRQLIAPAAGLSRHVTSLLSGCFISRYSVVRFYGFLFSVCFDDFTSPSDSRRGLVFDRMFYASAGYA